MWGKRVVMWGLVVTAAAMAFDLGASGAEACWGCGRSCGYGCGGYASCAPSYGSYYGGYWQCRGGCVLGDGGCYRACPSGGDGATYAAYYAPAACGYPPPIPVCVPPAYLCPACATP